MSLYISTKTASSELTDSMINHAITFLAATIAVNTQHNLFPDGPSLDATFLLPGAHDKPDFSGMQMGGYNPKGNTLFFEIAVPEHIVHSDQAKQYLTIVMQDVIANANVFFSENKIEFDVERWNLLLDKLNLAEDDLVSANKFSLRQ